MKKLLNLDLYIKETFDDFKVLIKQFIEKEEDIIIKNKIIINPIITNKKIINTLNLEDVKNENYDGYTVHDLFELINNILKEYQKMNMKKLSKKQMLIKNYKKNLKINQKILNIEYFN